MSSDEKQDNNAVEGAQARPLSSDPYGAVDESTFPVSYNEYRVMDSFSLFAHSEEQARQRWQFFKDVLTQLFVNEWHPHDLVAFVIPESMDRPGLEPTVEFVQEHTIDDPQALSVGMGGSVLPQWAWVNPDHDADWDPGKLAYRIFYGHLDSEDEEMLEEHTTGFTF